MCRCCCCYLIVVATVVDVDDDNSVEKRAYLSNKESIDSVGEAQVCTT